MPTRRTFLSGAVAGAAVVPLLAPRAFASRDPGLTGRFVELNSNENPYGPSPRAVEALRDALRVAGRYPDATEDALVSALHAGRLAGAALDVFDTEPLPAGHPLLACEQVVLTPHNADQTPEGMDLLNAGVVDNVIAFLEGRPQNVVA